MKKILTLILVLVSFTIKSFGQYGVSVGIDAKDFWLIGQNKTNWCWAAAIQMVLDYYKVDMSQEKIVERTFGKSYYGELPNWAGSIQNISTNLNNWGVNRYNKPLKTNSIFLNHRPSPEDLVEYLTKKQPIILSYKSGYNTNHAIVIINCRYVKTTSGIQIIDFTAADPWKSVGNGYKGELMIYSYKEFYDLMNYYWLLSVKMDGDYFATTKAIKNCNTEFCTEVNRALNGFDNDFTNVKTKIVGDAIHTYYTNLKFTNANTSSLSTGILPYVHVSFYRGEDEAMANDAFERLKLKLNFLEGLEEAILVPYNNNNYKRREINIRLENDRVICLQWRREIDLRSTKYTVNMTLKTNKQNF